MWTNIEITAARKKYLFYVINHIYFTLYEPLVNVSETISMCDTFLFHWQILNGSLFEDTYCLNYITHSSVLCSFADNATQAVTGLLAHSYKPNREFPVGIA